MAWSARAKYVGNTRFIRQIAYCGAAVICNFPASNDLSATVLRLTVESLLVNAEKLSEISRPYYGVKLVLDPPFRLYTCISYLLTLPVEIIYSNLLIFLIMP